MFLCERNPRSWRSLLGETKGLGETSRSFVRETKGARTVLWDQHHEQKKRARAPPLRGTSRDRPTTRFAGQLLCLAWRCVKLPSQSGPCATSRDRVGRRDRPTTRFTNSANCSVSLTRLGDFMDEVDHAQDVPRPSVRGVSRGHPIHEFGKVLCLA